MPPFVASHEPVPIREHALQPRRPRDRSGSMEIFSPDRRQSNSTKLADDDDALLAAENYFLEVRRSMSRKSSSSDRSRRTLVDYLADETRKPAAVLPTTPRRKSVVKKVIPRGNSERPTDVKSSILPGVAHIGRQSPPQFSLDDSDSGSTQSALSPPAELDGKVSPARSSMDVDIPISDLELDDAHTGERRSTVSSPAVPSLNGEGRHDLAHSRESGDFPVVNGSPFSEGGDFQYRVESSPQDVRQDARNSVHEEGVKGSEMETEQPVRDGVSNSDFEWNEVFRRSARSPDSLSNESFKSSRSTMSSSSSRGSLSDEAISERAAAWGTGVAKLVLKNSSRESTPRTSDGSSADGVNYGQKIPRVARHVKEALSSFQLAFVVCDVIDSERPILFASAGFFAMTGYSAEEVIGRNCRFLHGVDTDPKEVARISLALTNGEAYSGTILNYKKNGTPFWNMLTLSPIRDDKGLLIKYMGMQAEVKHPSTAACRKKVAGDGVCEDIPRSICESIAEVTPSGPHERGDDVPIFTPKVAVTASDGNESKRYSLTHGIRGSKRYSLTPPAATKRHSISHVGRRSESACKMAAVQRSVGGSERYTVPTGKSPSIGPQQQPSKNSFAARPLYWLLTAARILEDEIARLGCDPNIAKECQEKFVQYEERRAVDRVKNKNKNKINPNKIHRVASGVLGLFRKLERKVFKRETSRPRGGSNRVNAYDFESDVEIDDFKIGDFPLVGTRKTPIKSERQDLRSESMPHMSPTRGVSISSSVLPVDLRARSNRYLSSAMSDRLEKRISASYTNEFVPDRQQFCIVHE